MRKTTNNDTPPQSPISGVKQTIYRTPTKQLSTIQNNAMSTHSNRSVGSSTTNSSEVNIFDTKNNGGFSFDAFGLDASQVNREVNEAMQSIVGSHPDLSFFVDQDPGDVWDSPNASRSSTPVDGDGFVDGFRVSKPLALHVRHSPTASTEKSSLTSENSESQGRVNPFKEQAGFSKSKTVVRPSSYTMTSSPTSKSRSVIPETRKVDDVDFVGSDVEENVPASDVGVNSDVIQSDVPSDVGVNSDVMVGSVTARRPHEIPGQVPGSKHDYRSKREQEEEKKNDEPDTLSPRTMQSPAMHTNTISTVMPDSRFTPANIRNNSVSREEILLPKTPTDERPSVSALKERFKSPITPKGSSYVRSPRQNDYETKSDGGAAIRNSHVQAVLTRLRNSPSSTEKGETSNESSKSDAGISPRGAFYGVKLRKTDSGVPLTEQSQPQPEDDSRQESLDSHRSDSTKQYKREEQNVNEYDESPDNEHSRKKMSYRERRELELQKEREGKRQKEHQDEQPIQRDVASLIKRHVAVNKNNSLVSNRTSSDDVDQECFFKQREMLKPVTANHISETQRKEESRTIGSLSPTRKLQSELIVKQENVEDKRVEELPEKLDSSDVSRLLMLRQVQQKAKPSDDVGENHQRFAAQKGLSISTADPTIDEQSHHTPKAHTPKATMMMLNAFLAGRDSMVSNDGCSSRKSGSQGEEIVFEREEAEKSQGNISASMANSKFFALKNDPSYQKYFKMLKVGMPMDVVKHAMTRDGVDPSVMDGDHNAPVGVPLKDDLTYQKYFRMLKIGLPMEAVKHAMERDGLDSSVMDQDHNAPVASTRKKLDDEDDKDRDSHRRARLHWKTLRKVTSNSLWAELDQDEALENIEIDEDEFQELFQVEKSSDVATKVVTTASQAKKSSTVKVIEPKRANNGGIVLARIKMTHDDMADAVDRIDEKALTAEQVENIIEYLPTKEERKSLETYMLEGGQDAGEKFESLCECEKFMVSMMTVKHAKRKVRALLFRLQFETCLEDIYNDTLAIETSCDELLNSTRLKQLLGIVLTFGNRLNTAGNGTKKKAGAFTLDSLLKLNQAKAFDKKTTFLQYIVLIVQRNNELLLRFKDDLPSVFKADKVYWDQCLSDLEGVENELENIRKIALYQARQNRKYRIRRKKARDDDEESLSDDEGELSLEEEVEALRSTAIGLFTLSAIKYVSSMRDKVEQTNKKFIRVLEYFGEEERKMQPHELFNIIVSFSRDFDKAKEEAFENEKIKRREERKRSANAPKRDQSGKPPAHSAAHAKNAGASELKPIRVSNMQPNMSSVLKEVTTRSHSSPQVQQPKEQSTLVASNGKGNDPSRKIQPERKNNDDVSSSIKEVYGDHGNQKYATSHPFQPHSEVPAASASSLRISIGEDGGGAQQSNSLSPIGTTPRSMASLRAKARLRRQRLTTSDSNDKASYRSKASNTTFPDAYNGAGHIDEDDAESLSPRSSMRARIRVEQRMNRS